MGSAISNQAQVSGDGEAQSKDPVLHMWPAGAAARAILMAAKAANVDLEIQTVDILQDRKPGKFNPDKGLPILMIGQKRIKDSHEMMRTLMRRCVNKPRVYPEETEKHEKVEKMLTYDMSKVFPAVTHWLYPQVFQDLAADPHKEKAIHTCLDHLNEVLNDQPCLAIQQTTVADFFVLTSLTLLEMKDFDFGKWTRVKQWLQHMKDLPYYNSCNQGLTDWKKSYPGPA